MRRVSLVCMLVAMTLVAFVGTATSADLAVKADLGGISMTLGIGEMVEDYDYGVVIGGGVSFGKLAVEGQVTVEGEGVVEADINAQSVTVGGSVTGNVTATERVDLQSGGRLVGDVKAARLTIADGATFKGNVDMDV